MKPLHIILSLFLLLTLATTSQAQLFETKKQFSLSVGSSFLTGSDNNILFPSGKQQSGMATEFAYSQKILSWLDGGIHAGFCTLSESLYKYGVLGNITPSSETVWSVGPTIIGHLPFRKFGLLNRLRFNLLMSPQFVAYSGNRNLLLNNEIHLSDGAVVYNNLSADKKSASLGLKINPSLVYHATQQLGIKLSYSQHYFGIQTSLSKESVSTKSVLVGLVYTFDRPILLF